MIKKLCSQFVLLSACFSVTANDIKHTTMDWQLKTINKKVSLRGCAISDKTLWVSGSDNTVFISNDNGKTWLDRSVKSDIKTGFRDIEVFDDNTAIVMGIGSGIQSTLFKTVDAGKTWEKLYQNQDKKGFFDSIAFWDENNGLLMGDPVDGFYVIKRTKDGGKTWSRISQNNIPKMLENESAFAASGNTLIVGDNGNAWFTTGGLSASVYSSDDFGNTWHREAVPLYQETPTSGGYALALNSQKQLFVMGGDYLKRDKKYNNLASLKENKWSKVNTGGHGLRTAMTCIKNKCLTTGKLSSDISFDNGINWQLLNSKSKQGFYTLASNKSLILAAGADGSVGIIEFTD